MGTLFIALILLFISVVFAAYILLPIILEKWETSQKKRSREAAYKAEEMFLFLNPKRLIWVYIFLPIILAAIGYFLYKIWGILGGIAIGLIIPTFLINVYNSRRKAKFSSQLLDSLMILSSSLRGGLSIIQSFEVLAEEMPAPMGDEISLMVREIKIGVTLEEALVNLNKRMPSDELDLIVSAILVGRETGGDLTKVFSRLVTTIRDRMTLKENVKTLTLQGRLQGVIMSLIPPVFAYIVYRLDPHHFDIMLKDDLGRLLLGIAVALQIIGLILIKIFSKVEV